MTSTISLRREGLAWRAVDREVVVLDLQTSTYFSLNNSGSVLWQLLAEGTTPDRLSQELAQSCGLDPVQAGDDVHRFLAKLDSHRLLGREAAASA